MGDSTALRIRNQKAIGVADVRRNVVEVLVLRRRRYIPEQRSREARSGSESLPLVTCERELVKHYIEIPYETFYRLQFPDLCPFTLRPGPEAIWEVHGKTRSREAFSIPGVVMVTKNRKYRFPLPAAAKFVRTQKKLRMASGLLIALFLLSVPFQIFLKVPGEIVGAAFLLWPVILMLIFLERWRQRNVRIDYVGNRFVEIVIRKTKYADEFCRINGLQSKRKLINFRWE